MFLHLSAILFTGGGVPGPDQVHPPGRYTPRQVQPLAGTLRAGTPPARYTPWQCMLGYGHQAGGTHPTGMHSCFIYIILFKVVVCETEAGQKELLSFVMPNQILPTEIDIKNYLVPVDSIERASGLLLFDKIPRKTFSKINGKSASFF